MLVCEQSLWNHRFVCLRGLQCTFAWIGTSWMATGILGSSCGHLLPLARRPLSFQVPLECLLCQTRLSVAIPWAHGSSWRIRVVLHYGQIGWDICQLALSSHLCGDLQEDCWKAMGNQQARKSSVHNQPHVLQDSWTGWGWYNSLKKGQTMCYEAHRRVCLQHVLGCWLCWTSCISKGLSWTSRAMSS